MRYATPLPINKTPVLTVRGLFPPFCNTPHPSRSTGPRSECRRSVSSVVRYARPRFHRLFCPSPPDEHDHAFCSDPAGWLPMNTTTTMFLHSDPAMYVCVSRRSRPCPYVRTWPYFLSCTLAIVRTCACYVRASTTTHTRLYYYTCAPLHRLVYMYVHIRDQNDNATYTSTRWVPTVRHFLACEDVAGGSQQSGGESFFCPNALPYVRRCSWWIPTVRGNIFFAKYGGLSGGSRYQVEE